MQEEHSNLHEMPPGSEKEKSDNLRTGAQVQALTPRLPVSPLGKTIESKDYSHGISGEEAVTTVRHGKYSSADPEKEDDSVEPSPHMLLQTPRQDRNEIANSRESLQDAALRDAKSIEVYA